jgi:YHS domain-containing protein
MRPELYVKYRNYPSGKLGRLGRQLSQETQFIKELKTMTKDPVCGMNVDENNSQYQTQYGGKKFNFCSEQCKKKFDQQPEQYARSVSAA